MYGSLFSIAFVRTGSRSPSTVSFAANLSASRVIVEIQLDPVVNAPPRRDEDYLALYFFIAAS